MPKVWAGLPTALWRATKVWRIKAPANISATSTSQLEVAPSETGSGC